MISDYITISFCGAQRIFPNDSMLIKLHKSPATGQQKGGQKGLAVTYWCLGKMAARVLGGAADPAPFSVIWIHQTCLPTLTDINY